MTILQACLFGIVEGVTEFLPISSTGHLILLADLLRLPDSEFLKSFEIMIQLGAILAVVVLHGRTLLQNRPALLRTLAAFVPTAVIGFLLYAAVKTRLLGNTNVVVWALLLGGLALVAFERWQKGRIPRVHAIADLPMRHAALIGVFQALAVVPGVSRSAATVVGGLLLGMSRPAVVELSFLLAIPTMAAATGLDLLKSGFAFTSSEWTLLAVGFVVAFVVALAAVKWLLAYVRAHDFTPFGVYRVLLALVMLAFLSR